MKLALDSLYPHDTFNLITFAGDTHILFPEPVPATKENLAKAQAFLESRAGRRRHRDDESHQGRARSVRRAGTRAHRLLYDRRLCRQRHGDHRRSAEASERARVFVRDRQLGQSISAGQDGGSTDEAKSSTSRLNDDGSAAARRFHERVRNPLLTDISIDWNGLPVADVYPQAHSGSVWRQAGDSHRTLHGTGSGDNSSERKDVRAAISYARFRSSFRRRKTRTTCWRRCGRARGSMI